MKYKDVTLPLSSGNGLSLRLKRNEKMSVSSSLRSGYNDVIGIAATIQSWTGRKDAEAWCADSVEMLSSFDSCRSCSRMIKVDVCSAEGKIFTSYQLLRPVIAVPGPMPCLTNDLLADATRLRIPTPGGALWWRGWSLHHGPEMPRLQAMLRWFRAQQSTRRERRNLSPCLIDHVLQGR